MKALKTKGKFALTGADGDTTDAPKGTDGVRIAFGKDSYLLIYVYDATSVRLSVGNTNGQVMVSGGNENDLLVSIIE